jgi:hypothetical protein
VKLVDAAEIVSFARVYQALVESLATSPSNKMFNTPFLSLKVAVCLSLDE